MGYCFVDVLGESKIGDEAKFIDRQNNFPSIGYSALSPFLTVEPKVVIQELQ